MKQCEMNATIIMEQRTIRINKFNIGLLSDQVTEADIFSYL